MKGKIQDKERFFSLELESKANLKNVTLTNGSNDGVLVEGTIGELVGATFAEGIILEIVGRRGTLRINLMPNVLATLGRRRERGCCPEKRFRGGEIMRKLRIALIAVIVILSLAAFKTATTAVDASKACLLGYKAFCSFTPVSTLILAMAAIGTFFATRRIVLGGSA